jgi:hypothetical protein
MLEFRKKIDWSFQVRQPSIDTSFDNGKRNLLAMFLVVAVNAEIFPV